MVVDEGEEVGLAASDHRAVQGVAGPQIALSIVRADRRDLLGEDGPDMRLRSPLPAHGLADNKPIVDESSGPSSRHGGDDRTTAPPPTA